MKKYLIVFLFTIAIGQDTLITNSGVIYSGEIINSTPNYVEFFPNGWQYSTKLSTEKIKQLIDNGDQVKIGKDEKIIQQETYSIPNSPIVGRKSDKMYVAGVLRPNWNFHQPKDPFKAGLLSFFMPSGGHIYNEEYNKGALYLFGVPMLYVVGSIIVSNNLEKENDEGVQFGMTIQLSTLFFHFYNVYDAVMSSHRINKEYLELHLIENKND